MQRVFDTTTAAFIAGCDVRWADNVLSRFAIPGVVRARRGVTRRLDARAVRVLAIARQLSMTLEAPLTRSVSLAIDLGSAGETALAGHMLTLRIDLSRLQRELDRRMREAAELLVLPRRGRPRARARHPR